MTARDPAVHERGQSPFVHWATDGALAAAATGAELALLLNDARASVVALTPTVIAGAALLARRRAPLTVLVVNLIAAVTIVAAGRTPAGISLLVALYGVAELTERRHSLIALVPTVAVVVAITLSTDDQAIGKLAAAPLAVGVWALGSYVQTRRRYVAMLEQRAADLARIAVHEERAAIARELHDIVAHSVSVMLLGVRGARDIMHRSPTTAADTLERVERSGEQSIDELRRILALLRDPDEAAERRPQPSLAELPDLVDDYRAAGLPAQLHLTGEPRPLPAGVELSAYRIVQEALTNAAKHGDPTQVDVTVAFDRRHLDVEIVDDGARTSTTATPGHGLLGMRERVALLGGRLEAGRRNGGFRVAAYLPLRGER